MEDPEVPIEPVQEHIEHHAHMSKERWISAVALSTAILAALAAIASLLAGDHANEGMLNQIKSSDQWSFYQAKSIKSSVLGSKIDLLKAAGKPISEDDNSKLAEYTKDQTEIREKAEQLEKKAEGLIGSHLILARAVTLFQIAIAIGAIAVLTNRRVFWGISLALGAGGIAFLISGLLH